MRAGSLCAGIGGADLALEALGFEIAWHAEIDPDASAVLAHHWPHVPNVGDIKAADWSQVEPVDVIVAGFPCQPASTAGKRGGTDDERWLWDHVAAAIAALRPRFVFLENVPGLLTVEGRNEPDRCVCGWPYRRRGLHRDCRVVGGVFRTDRRRHDEEGASGADRAASTLGRHAPNVEAGHVAMGGGLDVDLGRVCGIGRVDGDPAAPGAEGRAGDPRLGGATDQGLASADAERPQPLVDRRGAGVLSGAPGASQGAERQGAVTEDDGDADCPACGRALDCSTDDLVPGAAYRTVLADLAALGFDAEWGTLSSAAVGACHRRERLWVVAADTDRGPLWSEPVTVARGGGEVVAGLDRAPAADDLSLLPTPTSADGKGGPGNQGRDGGDNLRTACLDFGHYQAAVDRWAAIFGPPPAPTEPNTRGGRRLHAPFPEWMMGFPAGWVTDHVGRAAALRCIGNAIQPQTAVAAWGELMARLERAAVAL